MGDEGAEAAIRGGEDTQSGSKNCVKVKWTDL